MPVSTNMGYMLNNLVDMLCGAYGSLIYQTQWVCTVRLFINQFLYILYLLKSKTRFFRTFGS